MSKTEYEYEHDREAWMSIENFKFLSGLENIPKAEFNIMFGLLLFVISACFSANKLAFGLLFASVINYFANDKQNQDSLVQEYMQKIGPTGRRDGTSMGGRFYRDGDIQKIIKGFTHPLFRKNGQQENLGVIDNAVALRMF